MQNEKQITRRLIALRSAADILKALQDEMPVHRLRLEAAEGMVRKLADQYEARSAFDATERKPPQRVTPRGRRPVVPDRKFASKPAKPEPAMDNTDVSEENEG